MMQRIEKIFSEFDRNITNNEITVEEMKQELKSYPDGIVLYGAGSAGIAFFHYLTDAGIIPCYFADGDNEKWGRMCEGLEIISPEDIVKRNGENTLVIVTINTDGQNYCKDFKQALLAGGHKGVHKKLSEYGCKNVIDYTFFRRCYKLFCGERYNLPACSDIYLMRQHKEDIQAVYGLLEDESSRETFARIVEFRLLDDGVDIPIFPEENMYFEYDLFERKADEIFVDCGACGGSSLKGFMKSCGGSFEKYYAIEPDLYNYEKLEEYVSGIPKEQREKIECSNRAAYSTDEAINFFILHGPGSFAAENGKDRVKTIKIDTLTQGSAVSYIKMNIEGSEVEALKGARNAIMAYRPRLAIMGYHKTDDLWKVPMLIKDYRPDYKIYLRSYMHNIAFAYYAC